MQPWKLRPLLHDAGYLHPHACFVCQKSFKRYIAPPPASPRKCPQCGGPVVALNREFKPPPSDEAVVQSAEVPVGEEEDLEEACTQLRSNEEGLLCYVASEWRLSVGAPVILLETITDGRVGDR